MPIQEQFLEAVEVYERQKAEFHVLAAQVNELHQSLGALTTGRAEPDKVTTWVCMTSLAWR